MGCNYSSLPYPQRRLKWGCLWVIIHDSLYHVYVIIYVLWSLYYSTAFIRCIDIISMNIWWNIDQILYLIPFFSERWDWTNCDILYSRQNRFSLPSWHPELIKCILWRIVLYLLSHGRITNKANDETTQMCNCQWFSYVWNCNFVGYIKVGQRQHSALRTVKGNSGYH